MKKVTVIFALCLTVIICFGLYTYVNAESRPYVSLAPIPGLTDPTTIPTGTSNGQSGIGFAGYLRALYVWGVSAASGLAVVMIMWGGVEYMTSAGGGGVEEAKKRISAAIMGLLLALGSYIILSAVNKDLLNLQFEIGDLKVDVNGNAAPQFIPLSKPISNSYVDSDGYLVDQYGERIVDQNNNMVYVGKVDGNFLNSLPSSQSGNVTFTSYGYPGDLTPDTNSSQARGNHNNLLVAGSVALSPDLISQLRPKPGAAVYVGGTLAGYYDDSTAAVYNGKTLTNRVDIYDPSGALGGNNFSKKVSGAVTVDNSNIRPQTPNPSR